MTEITIYTGESVSLDHLYANEEWKEYVCADFDENVVLYGNRDFRDLKEADWYRKATDLIYDLDNMDENDFLDEYSDTYNENQLQEIMRAYNNCRYSDDMDFIKEIIEITQPNIELEQTTIRGYNQSDWEYVLYVKDSISVDVLEAYFFGKLSEICINIDGNENWYDILNDDLWEMERGDLKKELIARYGITDNDVVVKQFSGYSKIANFEEV